MSKRQALIRILLSTVVFLLLIYFYSEIFKDSDNLQERGIQTKAVIVKSVNLSRGHDYKYVYEIKGTKYFGWFKVYKLDFNIGDSILIHYLPEDPETSLPIFDRESE